MVDIGSWIHTLIPVPGRRRTWRNVDTGSLPAGSRRPMVIVQPRAMVMVMPMVQPRAGIRATSGSSDSLDVLFVPCVATHRRMRTVTNYFLVNLSAADLMMSLLNCVFNFIFMINSDWPFGATYCVLNNFISNATVAASAFTLVAISVDRYMAIVRPLQHSLSRSKAGVALVVVWLSSGSLALPCLLYSNVLTMRYASGQSRIVCYMMWPDGKYPNSLIEYMYNVVFLALTYLVPVTVMAVCYTLMARELWGNRAIGELTQRQLEAIRSKRKVILMFIIVVSIFAVCWLPYHGFFIYSYHNTAMTATRYVQHIYLAFYWFAMANAMVNPLIYYWMNCRFRLYFKRVICLCCWLGKDKPDSFELPTTKHSQSELARVRSASCRAGSQKSRRAQEVLVRQVGPDAVRHTADWAGPS
ncbi:tachykinin-like peptides receptor 86C [Bacillus rossius redtenbacheri]|uniref:tachykinin-like peptides receptor 86C n=1 Tax=Bacillus rossius redtenbacheri TaxID=93214 RepID=UPI002FDD81BA